MVYDNVSAGLAHPGRGAQMRTLVPGGSVTVRLKVPPASVRPVLPTARQLPLTDC